MEKKYSVGGTERRLLTGIIEGRKKQIKINIWSENALTDRLEPNATYLFSKGRLEDGVINFGEHAEIERIDDDGIIPLNQLHYLRDLASMDDQ